MSYLTPAMTVAALMRMREFEGEMRDTFSRFGLALAENTGRRNIIMSQAQENFFAQELAREHEVVVDGSTGEADIMLPSLGRELECKISSGSGRYRRFSLQTDYVTLTRKGELDFLFVLADPAFREFAVLHFERLTPDDFHPPSPGARQKARMRKERAMDRCNVLWGEVLCRNDGHIERLKERRRELDEQWTTRLLHLGERIIAAENAPRRLTTLGKELERERLAMMDRSEELTTKLDHWRNAPKQFGFVLSPLEDA